VQESQLVQQILLEIGKRRDVRIWRSNTGAAKGRGARGKEYFVRFGVPGAADLSGLLAGGRRLEVECKSGRGRVRPEQKAFAEMVERFGGLYVLARSVEDVERAINVALYGSDVRTA
jgi:hypothetical protein